MLTHSLNNIRTKYNSTYPVNSKQKIKFDTQFINSYTPYDQRLPGIGGKIKGFLEPPYSGWFNLLIRADDSSDIWISDGARNASTSQLRKVASISYYSCRSFFYQSSQKSELMYLDRDRE